MTNKVFVEFQGNTIRIGGDCYTFTGETTASSNATPSEIDGTYASCLECNVDSSSESSSSSSSSSSSFPENSSSSSSSGAPADTCTGINCSGDPSMKLTVSNLGATETISWVGETWDLPADNGVQKCVCPTTYNLILESQAATNGDIIKHEWEHFVAGSNRLHLRRQGGVYTFTTAIFNPLDSIRFNDGGSSEVDYIQNNSAQQGKVGVIVTGTSPTYVGQVSPITGDANLHLPDEYFGSHTASSVTYTWAKGNDW